jgi:hypothetical protein
VSPLKKKLFETPKLVDTSIAKDLQPWSLNSLNFNSDATLTPLANHLIIWLRSLHIPERSQGLHGFTPWSPAVVQTCRNHMILVTYPHCWVRSPVFCWMWQVLETDTRI